MRTAFGVALALSLSLAVVRANEKPESIFADSVSETATLTPSNPLSVQNIPGNAAAGEVESEESVLEPAPTPAPPSPPKVCVMLKAKSFEINTDSSPRPMSAEPMAYLLCDNVQTTSSAGGATTLKCTNCKLTLPNGVSATASDVAFDTKTNLLILNGSDKSPVTITHAGTESKAAKVEMKIDPSEWRGAQLAVPAQYDATSVRQMTPIRAVPSQPQALGQY